MSKETSVILLGVAVVVIPYLGAPLSWRILLLVIAGLTLIIVGFLLRARGLTRAGKTSPHHSFVENDAVLVTHDQPAHEHKEGITSLN